MELSVIIVNYNVRVFLEHCLGSVIRSLEGISGEIIVVDNASEDGSVEMMQQKFPTVTIFANRANIGFGSANNQAVKSAKGEILFFLNPDTIVQEDTFKVILHKFKEAPEVGIVGCKVLNPDGTLQPACRRSIPTPWVAFTKIVGLSALFPESPIFSKYNLTYKNPDESYEVDAVSGSCMAVRKSDFLQIGGFDEQFFMYGEDLDLCYRIQKAGKKVFYLHTTQIIHYKGESVRRSDINEIRVFYQAMHVFVKKHFSYGFVADIPLRIGIAAREFVATIQKHKTLFGSFILDYFFVLLSWFTGEFFRFGDIFHFPSAAYPVVFSVLPLAVIGSLFVTGVYSTRKQSAVKTLSGVVTAFVLLSALTFFFKDYAFSRFILFITGLISALLLITWREVFRTRQASALFSHRTLIVGASEKGIELLHKLNKRKPAGYQVIGFIHNDKSLIGETVENVEILGSIETIGMVIQQHNISDVIFSSDTFTYSEILSVISTSGERNINYRLVPSSLEVIIGKTHIDDLNELPLVDIEYSLHRLQNRIIKRWSDVVFGTLLFLTVYPLAKQRIRSGRAGAMTRAFLNLPHVIKGSMSLVGVMMLNSGKTTQKTEFLTKPGITGLAQVNNFDKLSEEELSQYNIHYAKNQSFLLDFEILLRAIVLFFRE